MPARHGWIADELEHAGRENLDAAHAARYDDKEDAGAAAELATLRRLGLDRSATVVDLGAGTGQFALAAAGAFARVVAVDVSAVMLDRLRAKLRRDGSENVECVTAGFLTYEHRGAPPDLVYSRYALHHLPDFWKAIALRRIAELLRPGGILRLWDVLYGFEPAEAEAHIEQWIAQTASDALGDGWTRAELEEHVRDEHSTFTWLLEPMLERAGFVIEEAERSDDRIFARYTCVKAP
ncbi:MAG TPA: class I SAM-dependent methyltransferase [Conexibacter sp.]|nr:class I SAM-dependent methyltransferase [Conexibacter sp.]